MARDLGVDSGWRWRGQFPPSYCQQTISSLRSRFQGTILRGELGQPHKCRSCITREDVGLDLKFDNHLKIAKRAAGHPAMLIPRVAIDFCPKEVDRGSLESGWRRQLPPSSLSYYPANHFFTPQRGLGAGQNSFRGTSTTPICYCLSRITREDVGLDLKFGDHLKILIYLAVSKRTAGHPAMLIQEFLWNPPPYAIKVLVRP
ncbi:hypothetical protein FB451DRAFT_1195327 [Mycena latifolia]|nr:hypothetical protein FB451DRAFT_1195327 [Mycena latifolia]